MRIIKLRRIQAVSLLSLLLLAITTAQAVAQAGKAWVNIILQSKSSIITPAQFYISGVDDERNDNTGIGRVVQAKDGHTAQPEVLPARIEGGSNGLKAFIASGVPLNKRLRPLVIKIKAVEIAEKPVKGDRVDGRVALSMAFGLPHNDDFIKLDDYTASSTYQRKAGTAQLAGTLLADMIGKGLLYINTWISTQADKNVALARGVKVIFTDHKATVEEDTIYYDVNRPLKWTDFREKPHNSKYAAEIFAGLGYGEDVKLADGIINVSLAIKVYVPKSACWARNEGLNARSLSHEQRHFDIVKIVAEQFKQKITNADLSIYSYDAVINMAYLDALREIYELQKKYDNETEHSVNSYQQQQWSDRIDKELQQLGVKPLMAQAAGFN